MTEPNPFDGMTPAQIYAVADIMRTNAMALAEVSPVVHAAAAVVDALRSCRLTDGGPEMRRLKAAVDEWRKAKP